MDRTVLITPTWQVSMWNRVARLSESIAEALSILGRDVMVVTPQIDGGARRRWVDGIHIVEVADKPRGTWKENAKQAIEANCKGVSEAVVIDGTSWQVAKESFLGKIPVLGVVLFGQCTQGERIASTKTDALIAEENELIQKADKVLVNNEILRNRISTQFNREVDKLEMAASTAPEVDAVVDAASERNEGEVVVVGKIGPELGLEKIIRAMPDLPWLKLKVIGIPRSEWEMSRITMLVSRLGLQDRIKFSGWARTREVLAAIRQAEILIAPSLVEYFGYSAMDAMLVGTPVVASTANIHIEIIRDGDTGLLFQNQDELKDALNTLHGMPELRELYSEQALEVIKTDRTINRMAESLAMTIGITQ